MSSIIQNKFHEIIGDGARTTKFTFVLPPISGSEEAMDHILYSVKGCTLPTMSHQTIEFKHKGLSIPIRGVTKFSQQFTVTFYLTETHIVKRLFEEWMMMIEQRHYYYNPRKQANFQRKLAVVPEVNNHVEDDLAPYMTWYNVTAYIEQWDFDGMKPTAIYEIFNVFPIAVDAPTYSYDTMGQIAEFTVTFACSHFKLHSKGWRDGALQNQLFHTTDRWSQMGEFAQRGDTPGAPYIRAEGEYWWDADRFAQFGQFEGLEQTAERRQEIYWRPYELARWDNMWNRYREMWEGVNTGYGPKDSKNLSGQSGNGSQTDFDYDQLEGKNKSTNYYLDLNALKLRDPDE